MEDDPQVTFEVVRALSGRHHGTWAALLVQKPADFGNYGARTGVRDSQ